MSEGDAEGSFEVLNKLPASSSMDLSMMNEGRYLKAIIVIHRARQYDVFAIADRSRRSKIE